MSEISDESEDLFLEFECAFYGALSTAERGKREVLDEYLAVMDHHYREMRSMLITTHAMQDMRPN